MLSFLVTGFGAFPGAKYNPTMDLMAVLARRKERFARLGIRLETRVLPVSYAEIGPRLATLAAEIHPDAILHFGLAGRRKWISIETRAINRLHELNPDADGAYARAAEIVSDGPRVLRARAPVMQIAAALRRAKVATRLSQDAGRYLCNAAFYHSLLKPHAPSVGFIHVPRPGFSRPSFAAIVKSAEIAILITAVATRRFQPSKARQ
ncbi:MAG TPA: pyroglutamyl-peptidase I [Methylovirgula sp.]|nr:pyroglutamyl-peptidase I [Methylovirgula sp.]